MPWIEWYNSLAKPSWTPAPSTIGLIWGILYPIIAVSFGFVVVQAIRKKLPWKVALTIRHQPLGEPAFHADLLRAAKRAARRCGHPDRLGHDYLVRSRRLAEAPLGRRRPGAVLRLGVDCDGAATEHHGDELGEMMTAIDHKPRRPFLYLLVVTTLALVACPILRADDNLWKDRVDALAKPLIEKKKAFGIVVGIITPDGKREFFCYGTTKAGGPEPTPDTLFEIGSVSKPITALLLALMVEEGAVKLDDPVQKYLPKEIVVPRRGKHEITLLELVTHTSGLPRNPPNQQHGEHG